MSYSEFARLVGVIDSLRHKEKGCPWNLEQTHGSLLPYLFEESSEFAHAVRAEDDSAMEEELGDLLLQFLLHAKIAGERGAFDLESAAKTLADKMIRRHPHVFEEGGQNLTAAEVEKRWEQIKSQEQRKKSASRVDLSLPALRAAHKIGVKSKQVKFDWDDPLQVSYKVEEEWQELKEELAPLVGSAILDKERVAEELGDFLFAIAQLARHLQIDPEESLQRANNKFVTRFNKMKDMIADAGKSMENMNQSEMDFYWEQVKLQSKE